MNTQIYISFLLMICLLPGYWCVCSKTVEELDQCGYDTMFFGNKEAIIPSNEAEMDMHCNKVKGGIKCMSEYVAQCTTGLHKKVLGMMFTSLGNHLDNRCNKPDNRNEFIEHLKCFNPREKMQPLNECDDKHIAMVQLIKDLGKDDRSPALCCSFHKFHECIVTKSKKICGEGSSQYWDDIIQEVADESVSFACSEFDSLAKCDKLMKPDIWNSLKAISDSDDPNVYKHNYRSPIPLILEMIKN